MDDITGHVTSPPATFTYTTHVCMPLRVTVHYIHVHVTSTCLPGIRIDARVS